MVLWVKRLSTSGTYSIWTEKLWKTHCEEIGLLHPVRYNTNKLYKNMHYLHTKQVNARWGCQTERWKGTKPARFKADCWWQFYTLVGAAPSTSCPKDGHNVEIVKSWKLWWSYPGGSCTYIRKWGALPHSPFGFHSLCRMCSNVSNCMPIEWSRPFITASAFIMVYPGILV